MINLLKDFEIDRVSGGPQAAATLTLKGNLISGKRPLGFGRAINLNIVRMHLGALQAGLIGGYYD